jgi:hypothetical protein
MVAGGVYAHLWDESGIQVWFFSRGQVPQDISSGNPDPSTWGPATAMFMTTDSCNIGQHFKDHTIVINTDICGDWAGAAFSDAGCGSSCSAFVTDPNNFKCKFPLMYNAFPKQSLTLSNIRCSLVHSQSQGLPGPELDHGVVSIISLSLSHGSFTRALRWLSLSL